MNKLLVSVFAVVIGLIGCSKTATRDPSAPVHVRLVTTAGSIDLELDPARAPVGVANFLKYAESGAYDGTVFHRTVPGFVIQGGGYTKDLIELKGSPTILNEWRNGLRNARGTIAWARDEQPDTATREFYINLAENAKLDSPRAITGNAGYAVFGRVVAGMEVVDAIAAGAFYEIPERDMKHVPVKPVVVERVEVER
jgi:peptidyl-prolyl cis-trans isomerase A (cyclophilin A)